MASIAAALEELFDTDPSEFTKKRDELVKQLKKAGDKEAAAQIASKRKPTQMAHVLNQLARKHPDTIADLVDVGRELAREQRRAIRGEGGHSLRDSIDRQRKAITEAGKKAAEVMKELGVDPMAHLQEVTMALQAALIDPIVGAALEAGQLEKAPEAAVGFGGPVAPASAPAVEEAAKSEPESKPAPKAKTKTKKSEPPSKIDEEAEKQREREARERAKEQELARARAAHATSLAEAKAVLSAAESELEKTRAAVEAAGTEAQAADLVVEKAREAASAAHREAKRLRAELATAERTLEAAEKAVTKLEASAPD
jgi:hypothetical protein